MRLNEPIDIPSREDLADFAVRVRPWLIIALVISLPFIWNSDAFQELAFPQSYWRKQLEERKGTEMRWRHAAAGCRLELEKHLRTFDLEIRKLILVGKTPHEARDIVRSTVQMVGMMCQTVHESHKEELSRLNEARANVQRYAR